MFTGLVEEIGTVKSLMKGMVGKLVVASRGVVQDAALGDSISVSGVCLTVTAIGNQELTFDAVPETLSRSALGSLRAGDKVNLESSLRAGGKLGGHFVLGHVDGVGTVENLRVLANSAEVRIRAPKEVLRYVVEKGSIAVDGVSLTVAAVSESNFTLAAIPHTLDVTTLGLRKAGDSVNLETDILGKYVEKFISSRASAGVTEDMLRNAGFV